MKQLILLMLICFSLFTEGQTDIITNTNTIAFDACVSGIDLLVANQISDLSADGAINRYDYQLNLMDSKIIPSDLSSDGTTIPYEVSSGAGSTFVVAKRYFNSSNGLVSQSLFKLDSNLNIDHTAQEIVAFKSYIGGAFNNGTHVFAFITFPPGGANAKLVLNQPNGNAQTLLQYSGTGPKTWLYRGDVNDLGNFTIYQIGDESLSVSPSFLDPDGSFIKAEKITALENGKLVVEYEEWPNRYLAIVDPDNPGTAGVIGSNGILSDGAMNPVHLLGPYNTFTGGPKDVTLFDNPYQPGYVIGYHGGFSNNPPYEFLDTDFNPIHEPWKYGTVYGIASFFTDAGELYANTTSTQPDSETTRVLNIGKRAIEKYKKGHIYHNWVDFFKSMSIGELTSIHVANHVGLAFDFNGTPIDGTDSQTPSSNTMAIYKTNYSGLSGNIGLTDSNPDFDAVYLNHRLDLEDNTRLIPVADEHVGMVILKPNAIIPDDINIIPQSWKNDIIIPAGYKLAFGENALMATDPYEPIGFNRYFTIKIIPDDALSIGNQKTLKSESMKVYVTYSNLSVLGINDFENTAFAVYPNPTRDIVQIKTNKKVKKIEFSNIAGQIVLRELGNVSSVNLGQLPSGLYMLRIYSADGSQGLKKIIKQ